MIKSKTLQYILLFNEKELKNLTKFVHSSYFNTEKQVTSLYNYLLANIHKSPKKEDAYQYIYKNQNYIFDRIDYLNTQLLKLIKHFIELENFNSTKAIYNTSVLNKLRTVNQKHLYELEEKKIEKKNKKKSKLKSINYQENYLFEFERLNFYAEQQRTETKYIESLHFNLDAYYLIEKLKASCTSITQQKIYKTDNKNSFIKILIDYIKQTNLLKAVPLLNVYYNAYNMLVTDNKEYFLEMKKAFQNFDFEALEINDAFILGLNFCIQQNNKGNSEFNKEIFEMYQTGIENKFLLVKGKLSPITFSNVVSVGLRIKRFDEVERFIENKHKIVSGTEKKSYYSFNLAKVYFEKGEFENVTDLYNEKLITEVLLNIQMRILQIKAFYELNEIEIFESLVISTDQLLNRKGILAYHKAVFKNFIKYCKSLLALNKFEKKEVNKLKESINSNTQLIDKSWLLSKLK